jgi:hypothetical protein
MAAYTEFKKNPAIEQRDAVLALLRNARQEGADLAYYGIFTTHLDEALADISKLSQ